MTLMVSDVRRQGDADPNEKVVPDTITLIGNSGYGKTVTNKVDCYYIYDIYASIPLYDGQIRMTNYSNLVYCIITFKMYTFY